MIDHHLTLLARVFWGPPSSSIDNQKRVVAAQGGYRGLWDVNLLVPFVRRWVVVTENENSTSQYVKILSDAFASCADVPQLLLKGSWQICSKKYDSQDSMMRKIPTLHFFRLKSGRRCPLDFTGGIDLTWSSLRIFSPSTDKGTYLIFSPFVHGCHVHPASLPT